MLSGTMGSAENSSLLLRWLLSWIVTPTPQMLQYFHLWLRRGAHFCVYGVLALLWLRSLDMQAPQRLGRNVAVTLAVCLLVAFTDEGHQSLVSSRRGSLPDVALDMAGAAVMTLVALAWKSRAATPRWEARQPSS